MHPTLITPDHLKHILEQLISLEPIYHAACPDAAPEHFEKLVAPEFWEIGASGTRYARDFCLKVLSERQQTPDPTTWQTDEWHVSEAGEDLYLLTYRLSQPYRATLRSSLWRIEPQGWQVLFHQGTVVQESPFGKTTG